MSSYEIKQIGLEDYSKCIVIWNMETCPYTQTFVSQIKAGVREEYIITVDGAYIAEYDLFIVKKNYE